MGMDQNPWKITHGFHSDTQGFCLKMLGNAMESMGDAAARFHRLGDFRVSGRWRGTFVDARLHDMFQNEKTLSILIFRVTLWQFKVPSEMPHL